MLVANIFLFLLWANLGYADTLVSPEPREYFASNLSASTSLKKPIFSCAGDCFSDRAILAKRSSRKPSARKISNSTDPRPDLELNGEYFLNIFSDTKYILLSPLRWQARDWVKAGLVLGATGGLFLLDDEIRNFFQDERTSTTDDIASVFEPFGNGGYAFPSLVGFYVFGHFTKNKKAKRTALLAVESFAVAGMFTFALKFSTGRVRPQSAQNSREWGGPGVNDVSFPSGHTSSAFSIATVLASEYKNIPWVPPVAYGLATLTGLSRLNDNKHWASDVFFGGVMGYFIAKTVLKLHSSKRGKHYTIYPRLSRKEVGLDFAMRF